MYMPIRNAIRIALAIGLAVLIGACQSTAPAPLGLKDGVYTAKAQGNNGPLTVQTTIKGGKIADVAILKQTETVGVADEALKQIPKRIVETQSLAVDAISGATHVSDAILAATEDCLKQAGGNIAALKAKKTSPEAVKSADEIYSCDFVVIGAGGAGASAAVTAAEGGAKVIVVEKAAIPGGATLMSSGILATDSSKQKAAGIVCKTEDVYKSWQDYNAWLNDPVLTWKYFSGSAGTIDWLEAHGYQFNIVPNVQKTHAEGFETYHHYGSDDKKMDYIKSLLSYVEKNGGKILYQTRATKILTDKGAVSGIEAVKADGSKVTISAKSVLVATGGWGANPELVAKYTNGVKMSALNSGTQTGDGIALTQALGAGEARAFAQYHGVDMPFEITGAAATSGDGSKGAAAGGIGSVNHFANYAGGLWVNKRGERFASEAICYDSALVANATYAQGGDYYVVVDAKSVAALEAKGAGALGITMSPERLAGQPLAPVNEPWSDLTKQFDLAIKLGGAFKGATIADLAKAIGSDPAVLQATVDEYNKVCASKKDRQFGKDPMYLVPVAQGPYYAVLGRTVQLGGLGGIPTDSDLRVTDTHKKPIPGLYAAGADVAGIYNDVYPLIEGGTAGWAFNSGRLAGASVRAYLKK